VLQRLPHLHAKALEVALLGPCSLRESRDLRRELTNRIGDLLVLAKGQWHHGSKVEIKLRATTLAVSIATIR
jgi:hypothetical protein